MGMLKKQYHSVQIIVLFDIPLLSSSVCLFVEYRALCRLTFFNLSLRQTGYYIISIWLAIAQPLAGSMF